MKQVFNSNLLLLLAGLTALLPGCASFNDSVVVDIGDQFELLKLDTTTGQVLQKEGRRAKGFECEFEALGERTSLFSRERRVSGTIRCQVLEDPAPPTSISADTPQPAR